MNFEQLEFFLAIVKYRHFTMASEECNISQSSLSKKMQLLEAELGIQLMERSTRAVKITPQGLEFSKFCKEVLEQYYAVKAKIKHLNVDEDIVIGSVPVMTQLGITSMIASFQKEYPGINVDIIKKEDDAIISLLQTAKIDLAFLRTFSAMEDNFNVYPLFDDRMVMIVSNKHPFAGKKHLKLAEAVHEQFIFLRSPKMYDYCINACQAAGFTPNVAQRAHRMETILELVSGGAGVSLLMDRTLRHFSVSKIKTIRLQDELKTSIALIVPKGERLSQNAAAMKDFALQWAQVSR